MSADLKPLAIAASLRASGNDEAAECIETLYRIALDASIDNMQLRETLNPESGKVLPAERVH